MIGAGFDTVDPRTLTRSVVVADGEETGGRGWVPEVHCPEGASPAVLMVYRQTNDFGGVDASALHDVIGAFATINDPARAGKVDEKGLPRNPLQFAATLRALTSHGGYDASVPVAAQRVVAATLGRLAEALGYRGVDPRYSS